MNRINESPTLKDALKSAREAMLDNAESTLYKKVLDGSTPELIFFLKTQGRSRGYSEKIDIEIKDKRERVEIAVKQVMERAKVERDEAIELLKPHYPMISELIQ